MAAMSTRLAHQFGYKLDERLDIQEVVISAQNLLRLSQPLIAAHSAVRRIVEWQNPHLCVALLLLLNTFFLFLPQVYSVIAIIAVVGSMAVIGFCHRRYHILKKIFPYDESVQIDLNSSENANGHQERMRDFRLLIILVHSCLRSCSSCLASFYAVVKWDDLNHSIKSYIIIGISGLLLCILPLRLNVLLVIDVFLLWRPFWHGMEYIQQHRSKQCLIGDLQEPEIMLRPKSMTEDTLSQISDIQADPGIGTESDSSDNEKPPDDLSSGEEQEVAMLREQSPCCDAADSQQKPVQKTGVVTKILELKKRRQQAADVSEKCASCSVVFTTILKRRHICSHCGNHFCSRCCSHKVPRSTFGATSPAAQTETVSVCFNCCNLLLGGPSKLKIT